MWNDDRMKRKMGEEVMELFGPDVIVLDKENKEVLAYPFEEHHAVCEYCM